MPTDLRFACRTLAKSPGFTITAIAALALGIGANTAIFSVVNEVLLNPAGIRDPGQVVSERVKYDKLALKSIGVSAPDFADVAKSSQIFESAALFQPSDFNYTGSGMPQRLQGAAVSLHWFDVFGAKPRLGRAFLPEEDRPAANQVAVLSYPAWKRLFGMDTTVLGRTIELNEKPYRIVGIMGPEFRWPAQVDVWAPLGLAPDEYDEGNRFNESYGAVARLRSGVPFERGSALMQILNDRVRNNGNRGGAYAKDSAWGMFIVPFTDFIAGNTKTPMLVLLASVGFVLLIACANIAGLMLARSSGRGREIAIRAALGASRWDLVRQTIWESAVLATLGAAAGLALAYAGVRALLVLAPENAPVVLSVRLDGTVLLFTAGAALAAAILFGLAPAWQIAQLDRYDALKEGGRTGSASRARQHLRAGLVIGEVALALVLLVGAGLFLRSLAALEDVNPGFDANGVITGTVSLPNARYGDAPKRIAFYRAAVERLSSLLGATKVAAGVPVPFSGMGGSASFMVEGRPQNPGDPGPHGDLGFVTPGYFEALKIPLRSGRFFDDHDTQGSQPVVLIDETLARQYWPNEDPVGKHLRRGMRAPWSTIVGVVGHVKTADLSGDLVKGKYYYPLYQQAPPFTTFVVRTSSDAAALGTALRSAVQSVDGTQAVSQIKALSDMVAASLAPRRFIVTLLGFFASMALLMAALGLYGVISYSVSQRTQEIGIRMALGAQRGAVLSLVIGQGLRLAGAGAIVGLAASLAFSRLIGNLLYNVSAFDPLTFIAMASVLIAASLAASYIPARRAMRVDPIEALRYE